MENEIKIGIDMVESAQRIGEIVNLLSEEIEKYKRSTTNFTETYGGDATEILNYLEKGLVTNLTMLLNYYSVAAQCIVLALKEYIEADEKIAVEIAKSMEAMMN